MDTGKLGAIAGWSAIVSAVATIIGLLTLVLFFSLGGPWGTINDVSSVIIALSILPVLLVLHHRHRQSAFVVSSAALGLGALGLFIAILFQTLVIAGAISYAQTAITVPVSFGVLGLSLMAFGYLGITDGTLPRTLAWMGLIAGAGYVMVIIGFILGGQQHPLTAIGGLIAVIFYTPWAVWLGRILLSGR